jgi:redox-sensitive bicupin YhaK (pirin superfamily)
MTSRTISSIETATAERVGAFQIRRALPTKGLTQVDPFIFIDYLFPTRVKAGDPLRIAPHPHAGFDVVTYLLEGEFFHRDSLGHDQVARAGDLNWMSSGTGIIHSEGPTDEFLKVGGNLSLMQVWINLPAKLKFIKPTFQHFNSESLPIVDNGDVWVKILAGKYSDKHSPVMPHTDLFYLHIRIKQGKLFRMNIDPEDSTAIFVMKGKIQVTNSVVSNGQLINFNTDGDLLDFSAIEDAELILIGGKPLKEKLVSYGPFVMNSFQEIQQAITDYETGKMGVLDY